MSRMEEMRKKVSGIPLAEFAIKDPAALQLYGTTIWMVDPRAARDSFGRHKLSESQWILFRAALEERVEWMNERERGIL